MKRGQFNFVWLFALIAGGAILFLAIYGAMQTGDTSRYQTDTELAKSISIITDPLQAGFSEGSFGRIGFSQETRINNICFSDDFGRNDISVSTRSDVGKEWNFPGGETQIHNKYIFSSEKNSGEDYYVFSKPFSFPYKVTDLIFLTPEHYCFIGAPEEITDEIVGLNIPNIRVEDCAELELINVCFGAGADCDIRVAGSDSTYSAGIVTKDSREMKYVGNLMYAAIFSDKTIYDCNVKRLMFRTGKIAEELVNKADFMDARGCNTDMKSNLLIWSGLTFNADSDNLISLRSTAEDMDRKNTRELCRVWE